MWIDESLVFGLVLLAGIVWVIYRSPILSWLFVLLLQIWVCFFAVSAAAFVTFAIHIPKGSYGTAVFAMVLGVFLSALPTLVIWEHLVRHIKEFRSSLAIWE